jgi:hypothetical protein
MIEIYAQLPSCASKFSIDGGTQLHPGMKPSRAFQSGLSAFVSTSTTLCPAPNLGRLPSTAPDDGDTKAGSTWSRP